MVFGNENGEERDDDDGDERCERRQNDENKINAFIFVYTHTYQYEDDDGKKKSQPNLFRRISGSIMFVPEFVCVRVYVFR